MTKRGLLIVYSGPSGVGKSTLRQELFKNKDLKLRYSISMTTRAPRENEVDGVDYFFVSKERFKKAIDNDELLEHAEFVSNSYGTPKAYVDKLLNEGYNVMLEIEVQGAKQVMDKVKDALSIFLLPPSFEELKNRIVSRASEDKATIEGRLKKAEEEIKLASNYKYVVRNDDLNRAVEEITNIIKKEQEK